MKKDKNLILSLKRAVICCFTVLPLLFGSLKEALPTQPDGTDEPAVTLMNEPKPSDKNIEGD